MIQNRLRLLCFVLQEVPCFSWDEERGLFVVAKAVEEQVASFAGEMKTNGHTQMNVAQKKHMMKALAKQKLKVIYHTRIDAMSCFADKKISNFI